MNDRIFITDRKFRKVIRNYGRYFYSIMVVKREGAKSTANRDYRNNFRTLKNSYFFFLATAGTRVVVPFCDLLVPFTLFSDCYVDDSTYKNYWRKYTCEHTHFCGSNCKYARDISFLGTETCKLFLSVV